MSLEMNKIAASVLTAGVVAMGAGFLAEILIHPEVPEEPHYVVASKEGSQEGEGQQDTGPQPILPLLADADVEAGKSASRACQACHSFEKGGPNKVGPNLYGVVGSRIASVDGFSYSSALSEKEGEWTYQNLNAFLHDPQGWAPGTKMTFNGIGNVDKRADLVAYLRQNADDPVPLPSEEEIAAVTDKSDQPEGADQKGKDQQGEAQQAAADGAGEQGLLQRIKAADPADGQSAARVCQACHTFEQGGPNRVGPNLFDVVGQEIASIEGFSYTDALSSKEGQWTYEKLDAFLEDPQGWAKGTRMSFPGVKDADKRAAIIAYLRQQSENPPPLE